MSLYLSCNSSRAKLFILISLIEFEKIEEAQAPPASSLPTPMRLVTCISYEWTADC